MNDLSLLATNGPWPFVLGLYNSLIVIAYDTQTGPLKSLDM